MVIKKNGSLPYADHRRLIRAQAGKLADLLRQSPEYAQLISARSKLEADNESASVFTELRQRQMMLRMAVLTGEADDEEEDEFNSIYASLSQEPNISEYLFAEGRFFRLMSEVEEVFTHKLDLWQVDEEPPDGPRPSYNINLN